MIKLINLLELGINKGVTTEEVHDYYELNIMYNGNLWEKYKEICQSYCEKYSIGGGYISTFDFSLLSQQDLNSLYQNLLNYILY